MRNSFAPEPNDHHNSPPKIKIHRRSEMISPSELSEGKSNTNEALYQEKLLANSYLQNNERNIAKCKMLYNKLSSLGSMNGVTDMTSHEVSEIDVKIK